MLSGHDDGARLDCAERLFQVAAIGVVVADVAFEPGLQQGQQVIGIVMLKGRLPEALDEALAAVGAKLPKSFSAEEGLGEAPTRLTEGLPCANRRGSFARA